jgi:hypothetical protein
VSQGDKSGMKELFFEIEHIYKKYHKSTALKDLSLQVEKGDLFGRLRGPNKTKKSGNYTARVLLKITGLTLLFVALLSIDFSTLGLSDAILQTPIQVVAFAFVNTLLLSYFVLSSRWTGWKEWATTFTILYGMVYVLTAAEAFFLGSILSANMVFSLVVNGAVTSAIFSGALVWALGSKMLQSEVGSRRLQMPAREWVWKILVLAIVYLILFMIFGVMVYMPLGTLLDPVAFTLEQSIASNASTLVFPIELVRGALWTLFAVPAVAALPFDWKKTGLVIGLLMTVPLTLSQFMSSTETIGLQIAHSVEIVGANLVFGFLLVWVLCIHSRLTAGKPLKSVNS